MKASRQILFILFLIFFTAGFIACNQTSDSSSKNENNMSKENTSNLPHESLGTDEMPKIYFKENEHDFGELVAGEKITYGFKFSNTGGADLIIKNVIASCGCTATEFPKDPVKPGEEGVIKITFDSRGQTGYQKKTITIETNTLPDKVFVRIKASVKNS